MTDWIPLNREGDVKATVKKKKIQLRTLFMKSNNKTTRSVVLEQNRKVVFSDIYVLLLRN